MREGPLGALTGPDRPDARVHHYSGVREYWLSKLDQTRHVELADR